MQIVNQLKKAQDPMGMLEMMAQNNPNVANALKVLKESGGDPKKAVMSCLGQNGGFDLNALKKAYYGN